MKIVKVIYTTKAAFAEENQQNIVKLMADLQHLKYEGIYYNACLGADGKTFIHTAFFKTAEDQKALNELPSFKYFQAQLIASIPEISPKQEILQLIGASKNIFH